MNIVIEKNIMVPMRDGVRLATDVYRPGEGGPVPVLLVRLPFNKELPTMMQPGVDAPTPAPGQGQHATERNADADDE